MYKVSKAKAVIRVGRFRVAYQPTTPDDGHPWCVVNALDKVVRCATSQSRAVRLAKRYEADEASLDAAASAVGDQQPRGSP